MYLIPCNHNNNNLANFPESYDRIYLILIYEDIHRLVYQDRRTMLRPPRTTLSNPINPFCPNCKADVIDNFTYSGSSITEIDTFFENLRLKVSKETKSIDDKRRRKRKLGVQERFRTVKINMAVARYHDIYCFDSQELEALLAWAWGVGLLDVGEYTPRPNPAAKWAVDELERVEVTTDGDDNANRDDCVVCLEGLLKEEKIVRMPCKHEFHENCIVEWFSNSHVCPLCRFELPL